MTAAVQQRHGRRVPTYNPRLFAACRAVGRRLAHVAFRLDVRGLEHLPPSGPLLVAGNHVSLLDGPLVAVSVPRDVRMLAKHELYVGALGRFLHAMGQVPVDRGQPDRRALRAALAILADGGVVGVFPEGERGSGEFERVRDGVAYLALRSGAPIVPVACVGTAAALPLGHRLPRLGTRISVVFGRPVTVRAPVTPRSRREIARCGEEIRRALVAHLADARGAR